MAKRSPVMFAVGNDNVPLIKLKYSMIHPLIIFTDGIAIIYFKGQKTPYLKVQDVIDWHEKEYADSGGQSGSPEAAKRLRDFLDKFQRGEIVMEEG